MPQLNKEAEIWFTETKIYKSFSLVLHTNLGEKSIFPYFLLSLTGDENLWHINPFLY